MVKLKSYEEKIIGRIFLLIFGYFGTIFFETCLSASIQSLSPMDDLRQRYGFLLCFILLILWLIIIHGSKDAFAISIAVFKFVEIIPVLIDLIHLLLIYRYKIQQQQQHAFNRLYLSLSLILIRFLINLDVIRRRCDCQWKRRILVIIDLLLFILVNISLLRDSSKHPIRIGRKIILGVLIFQLNELLCSENFWARFIKSKDQLKHLTDGMHRIINRRWILSSAIMCLYVFWTFFGYLSSLDTVMCVIILFVIYWDTLQNRDTLQRKGISCLCIGFDLLPKIEKVDMPVPPATEPTSQITTDGVSQQPPSKVHKTGGSFFGRLLSRRTKKSALKSVSLIVGQGMILIENGDITTQEVDVIVGSVSSENLKQSLLQAAGDEVRTALSNELQTNPNSLLISTPSGHLHCKQIFFPQWKPEKDPDRLRRSIVDLVLTVVQNTLSHGYTSIAFPAIGCGQHACSVDIIVKTMVRTMRQEMQDRKLPWTVKFIIQANQQNVYDEFCRHLLSSGDYQKQPSWEDSKDDQLRVVKTTDEYNSIISKFDEVMKGKYTKIVKLERIRNERWYMQYMAHSKDFKKRLHEDTEKRLYHGCPESAAESIIQDCFNRSFAGINGTLYGFGVYFSSNPAYSHGYTKSNWKGERCMFVARVLVGKTTRGNSSMKTRPLGFDSTTDGDHITVTYHDAQAYADYLITYK